MKSLLVAAFVAVSVAANAVTLIGNYPQSNDTNTSAGLTTLRIKALGFVMPGQSYILNSITVRLQFTAAGVTGTQPLVQIRDTGTPTLPGAVLHTLTSPGGFAVGAGNYTFTSPGFTLNAGQKYWVSVANANNNAGLDWRGSSPVITPTGLATHDGSLFTANNTTWTNSATLNTYQIDATVVPEPATMAVLGLGALAIARRKRTR